MGGNSLCCHNFEALRTSRFLLIRATPSKHLETALCLGFRPFHGRNSQEEAFQTDTLYLAGVWTKCQPDKMPTGQNANLGWHFVRAFFSLWLAFCPDQLFGWHFVRTISTSESGGSCNIFLFAVDCCGEKSR